MQNVVICAFSRFPLRRMLSSCEKQQLSGRGEGRGSGSAMSKSGLNMTCLKLNRVRLDDGRCSGCGGEKRGVIEWRRAREQVVGEQRQKRFSGGLPVMWRDEKCRYMCIMNARDDLADAGE